MRRIIVRSISKVLAASLLLGLAALPGGLRPASAEGEAAGMPSPSLQQPAWKAEDIVPDKVMVKYKQMPQSNRAHNAMQSKTVGPKLASLTFAAGTDIEAKLAQLRQDPNVEYAEPVFKTYLIEPLEASGKTVAQSVYQGPEAYMQNWGHHATKLFDVQDETTLEEREAVTVAVLDTGIDASHPDLRQAVIAGYDFIDKDTDPFDEHGHGTHVAGLIGANAAEPGGYSGIAPGVKLMPVRVLDENGYGDTEQLVDAIEHAVANGADIINMSLGSSWYSRAVHDAVIEAKEAGVLMLAASGNESNHWLPDEPAHLGGQEDVPLLRYGMLTDYPALLDEVVSVGAVAQIEDGSYALADFSNAGRTDFVAPGVMMYSTVPGGYYGYQSGTSQATPIAAGYAALLLANNPELTGDDLRSILTGSASLHDLAELHETNYWGGIRFRLPDGMMSKHDRHVDSAIAYGAGMIRADEMFEDPFLRAVIVEEDLAGTGTITMDVYLTNIDGEVAEETIEVELQARAYDMYSWFRADDELVGSAESLTLVDGYGRATLSLGTVPEVYKYYAYAAMEEAGEAPLRQSSSITLTRNPDAPVADLASGTYSGAQQVVLTTGTAEALIEYVFVASDGSGDKEGSMKSGDWITIAESGRLFATAFKNKFVSEESVYTYTITSVNSGGNTGGGGGWSGGGFVPPLPTEPTDPEGQLDAAEPIVVEFDTDRILKDMEASSADLRFEVREQSDAGVALRLDAAVYERAAEQNKSIHLLLNGVELSLPPGMLQAGLSGTVEVKVTRSQSGSVFAGGLRLGSVYDLTLTVDGRSISSFRKPIEATFSVDTTIMKRKHQVNVFTLIEPTNEWAYAGGKWSAEGRTMSVKLDHFSKYAVIESSKSFSDMAGHWARTEVETLAARQIVNGMTDTLFEPSGNVTRGQMAALLSRMLRLDQSRTETGFADVDASAWYAGAIRAAKDAKLVSGLTDGNFAPNAGITREALATMAVQAYLYGTGQTLADIVITQEVKFADEGTISPWARHQVRVADALGIMSGAEGEFRPKAIVSRSEAAAVLYRLMEKTAQ